MSQSTMPLHCKLQVSNALNFGNSSPFIFADILMATEVYLCCDRRYVRLICKRYLYNPAANVRRLFCPLVENVNVQNAGKL